VRKTFDFDWFKVRWLAGYGWIVDRSPAIVVVPIAPDDRVWLVKLERAPTRTSSWELPGGAIDGDENVVAAALRELEEEAGLVARGKSRALETPLELAPGMGRFPHHVVVASGVVPRGKRPIPQREEGIVAVRAFDRARVWRMLRTGTISVQATAGALAVSGWLEAIDRSSRPRRRATKRDRDP
jgi:8-oxo-dGTP pyrophosphatase MutT (NUDIX family)